MDRLLDLLLSAPSGQQHHLLSFKDAEAIREQTIKLFRLDIRVPNKWLSVVPPRICSSAPIGPATARSDMCLQPGPIRIASVFLDAFYARSERFFSWVGLVRSRYKSQLRFLSLKGIEIVQCASRVTRRRFLIAVHYITR